MDYLREFLTSIPAVVRILGILIIAFLSQFMVKGIKRLSQRILTHKVSREVSAADTLSRKYPRFASLLTIFVSSVTFTIYFLALGLILQEFNVKLGTYLASASVIGLAIGFGTQGLIQDIVIGLTLIFSDALNVEDMVETSGQSGLVEKIGLRFTTIINLNGQTVFIPNRNIGIISRFRTGVIRAYVDAQIPETDNESDFVKKIESMAKAMRSQHRFIILRDPESLGVSATHEGSWRYLRIKFHLWPGQGALIETVFKQRLLAQAKTDFPEYADWMVTITYKGE